MKDVITNSILRFVIAIIISAVVAAVFGILIVIEKIGDIAVREQLSLDSRRRGSGTAVNKSRDRFLILPKSTVREPRFLVVVPLFQSPVHDEVGSVNLTDRLALVSHNGVLVIETLEIPNGGIQLGKQAFAYILADVCPASCIEQSQI